MTNFTNKSGCENDEISKKHKLVSPISQQDEFVLEPCAAMNSIEICWAWWLNDVVLFWTLQCANDEVCAMDVFAEVNAGETAMKKLSDNELRCYRHTPGGAGMSQCDERLCNGGVRWNSDEDDGGTMIGVDADSSSQKKPIETSCGDEHDVVMKCIGAAVGIDGAAVCCYVMNSSLCSPLYGFYSAR